MLFVVVRSSNHKVQCPNLKFKGTTNYANCTNHLAISIRVISAIVVIRSSNLNVQRTRDSNHKVQSSNLNVQRTRGSNHKVQSSNLNVQRSVFIPLVESYAHARWGSHSGKHRGVLWVLQSADGVLYPCRCLPHVGVVGSSQQSEWLKRCLFLAW